MFLLAMATWPLAPTMKILLYNSNFSCLLHLHVASKKAKPLAEKSDPTFGLVEQDKGTEFLTIVIVGQNKGPVVQGLNIPIIAQRSEDKGGTVSPTIMI